MYCKNCGALINSSNSFCENCGILLNENENNVIVEQVAQQPIKENKKKKLMWWIPLILFLMFPVCTIIQLVYKITFHIYEANILITILNLVKYISGLCVIPSIIFIAVKYNKN